MNLYKITAPLKVAILSSDPSPVENGVIYYNSSMESFRMYQNGTWQTVQVSGGEIVGSPLDNGSLWIGSGSNVAAEVDTLAQGDIAASASGLNIKPGVIVDADVSVSAAINLDKLQDTQNASIDGMVLIENNNKIRKTGILFSNVFLADGQVAATDNFDMDGNKIQNLADPTAAQEAATKAYVDTVGGNFASRDLSNLLPTMINLDLLPAADIALNLGSASLRWNAAWVDQIMAGDLHATNDLEVAGSALISSDLEVDGNAIVKGGLNMFGSAVTNVLDPVNPQDAATKNYVDTNISAVDTGVTGKPLTQNYVLIGNSGNQSQAVNSSALGHILADTATGMTIKNGTITNALVNATAAIDYSKLATIAGNLNDILVRSSSGFVSNSGLNTSALFLKDGSVAATAAFDMAGNKIINVGAPTNGGDAVNKQYVDSMAEGLKPKEAVRVASTGNLSFSGLQTIDGVAVTAGDRILVKDQTLPEQNGIYVAAVGSWTRATDFDQLAPINEIKGASVPVVAGTTNAGKLFVCTSNPTTIGTDPILFIFYNSVGTLVGGNGITVSGANISVNHDGQGLGFNGVQLSLVLDGSTLVKSGSGVRVNNTAFPASLVPDADNTRALGSATNLWNTVHSHGVINDLGILALQGQAATINLGNVLDIDATSLDADFSGAADITAVGALSMAGSGVTIAGITNGVTIQSKAYDFTDNSYPLVANVSTPTVTGFVIPVATYVGAFIEFSVRQANGPTRVGRLNIATDGSAASIAGDMVDQGTVGNSGALTFSVDVSGGNVRLLYTGTDATNGATLKLASRLLKA